MNEEWSELVSWPFLAQDSLYVQEARRSHRFVQNTHKHEHFALIVINSFTADNSALPVWVTSGSYIVARLQAGVIARSRDAIRVHRLVEADVTPAYLVTYKKKARSVSASVAAWVRQEPEPKI